MGISGVVYFHTGLAHLTRRSLELTDGDPTCKGPDGTRNRQIQQTYSTCFYGVYVLVIYEHPKFSEPSAMDAPDFFFMTLEGLSYHHISYISSLNPLQSLLNPY